MTSEAQKKKGYLLPETITGYQLQCVTMLIPRDRTYVAAFQGAVRELSKWWNWEKSYEPGDHRAVEAAHYWTELIEENMIFDDCDPEISGCIEFAPNAAIIEWLPQDPFTEPELVPEGYVVPPWYVAPALNLVGAAAGDVVTDVLRITSGSTWFGDLLNPPRFRVSISGTGVVELHLVNIIQTGGMAQIQVDGELTSLRYVDLNRDVASAPSETQDVIVIPLELTTPGDHFIDVTMLPNVDDSLIPIRFGGGLRKVVLCGFDQPPPENPEVPMFRFQEEDCQLQYSTNGGLSWVNIPGWSDFAMACFKGDTGAQGPAGETGETGSPGEDGAPGSSPDFPTETAGEDGDGKRCDVASYLAELTLPSLYHELQVAKAAEDDKYDLAAVVIGLVIAVGGLIAAPATAGGSVVAAFTWIAAGAGAGAAASAVTDLVFEAELEDMEADESPALYQDLKCAIYCALPDDGILTPAVAAEIAGKIDELASTYPTAAPIMAAAFRDFSEDARALISTMGALYEGSNCDICDCEVDCEAFYITWGSIGATLPRWTSPATKPTGVTNPSNFADGSTLTGFPQYDQMTRTANDTWRESVSNTAKQSVVKYEFEEPCLVKRAGFQTFSTSTNTKLHWIILELVGGEKRVITYRRNNAPTPGLQVMDYTLPVPLMATAIYYCYHTGTNPGTVNWQQSHHWLNRGQ